MSLQFSIIISLAIHLVVLVFASVVNIFQNPFQQPERKVAVRPERTILISDQSTQFVWEQPNLRDTPEPEIETQRQQPTTTNLQPQPIPVKESQPEFKPQIVKRETPARTIPRLDRELSQLRRQTQNLQPTSSQAETGQASSNTPKTTAESVTEPSSSSRADQVQRQVTRQPSPAATSAEKASANPAENQAAANLSASSPQRAEAAQRNVESAPQPSSSAARVTKSSPRLPVVRNKLPNPNQPTATSQQSANREPAPASTELTRRPVRDNRARPAVAQQPKTELSAKQKSNVLPNDVRQPILHRPFPILSPAKASPDGPRQMRRLRCPRSRSKIPRQPDSQSATAELNSRTLSVSKSTQGIAGVGKSQNLERDIGGMTSPAARASDSANRKRTESRPSESRMLTTSQSATTKRSTGAARSPTSAFRADTSAMAKISGSVNPTDQSVESSAANIDSASTEYRSEISAERGEASVDLGPTKVVAGEQSPRRSGGGQPDVAQLNPEDTRRSRLYSDQQPTLNTAAGSEAMAQSSPNSMPQSSELEPSSQATALSKSGGEAGVTSERDTAINQGDATNQGASAIASQIAEGPQRTERQSDPGSMFDQDDEEEDDEEKWGNQRTRIAQAPVTRRDTGLGNSRAGSGLTVSTSDAVVDTPSEALSATLQRQAASVLPGSGMSRTTTDLMLQAATSLPVIQPSTTRRTTRDARGADAGRISEPLPQVTAGPTDSRKPVAVPRLSSAAESGLAAAAPGRGNQTASRVVESAQVSVEKTETARSDPGAALEVDAIEGPAGLAERISANLGVMNRPASRESEQIQPDLDNRFRNSKFGGAPALNPDAVMAKEAFRSRSPAAIANSAEPTTEAAIQLGLEFLARYQSPDGSWSLSAFDQSHPQHVAQLSSDTAATGLALLAFQGAGYNHREFKYARQVNHGLQWLIENQRNDGCLYVESDERSNNSCRMYSHGIAALALTEAYGMTQDAQVRIAAQKALDYISQSQDPRKGGWRYFENPSQRSSDTSVSGWMMMALQSGKLAGLMLTLKRWKKLIRGWILPRNRTTNRCTDIIRMPWIPTASRGCRADRLPRR